MQWKIMLLADEAFFSPWISPSKQSVVFLEKTCTDGRSHMEHLFSKCPLKK